MKTLDGNERLIIFPDVDLIEPNAFDGPMKGCTAVIHTASPFFLQGGTEERLVIPAIEGTTNVLRSCTKCGIKRVVLTSSALSKR